MSFLARIRQIATRWLLPTALLVLAPLGRTADAPVRATQAPSSPALEAEAAHVAATLKPAGVVRLAPNVATEVARSALLTVQGTLTGESLRLGVQRSADKSQITADGVTVAVGGKSQSVSRRAGGYEIPLDDLREGDSTNTGKVLDVIVPHDGIRELLSGTVALAEDKSTGESLLRDHRQIAWWIVNIVVVLIAALAISRRKG